MLLGHSADSLPLFLKSGEFVGCLTPFGAVFQSLGALAESDFLLKVARKSVFHATEKLGLGGKELIACLTEAGKQRIVRLARSIADLLPIFLSGDYELGHLVPCGIGRKLVEFV